MVLLALGAKAQVPAFRISSFQGQRPSLCLRRNSVERRVLRKEILTVWTGRGHWWQGTTSTVLIKGVDWNVPGNSMKCWSVASLGSDQNGLVASRRIYNHAAKTSPTGQKPHGLANE